MLRRPGSSRQPRLTQRLDVRIAGLAREDVHVRGGTLRSAEAHGVRLGAAAEELLPQLGREVSRSPDRQDVRVAFPLEVVQQLPDRLRRHRKAGHQRRRE